MGRERLAELLRRLSEQGALRQRQLSLALELAGELQPGVLGPPHLTGGLAGALLVLLAAASGERLSKKRAEGLVHAAGGEASHSGISHNLARLREHWEVRSPAGGRWEGGHQWIAGWFVGGVHRRRLVGLCSAPPWPHISVWISVWVSVWII